MDRVTAAIAAAHFVIAGPVASAICQPILEATGCTLVAEFILSILDTVSFIEPASLDVAGRVADAVASPVPTVPKPINSRRAACCAPFDVVTVPTIIITSHDLAIRVAAAVLHHIARVRNPVVVTVSIR
jgi:hypothetical protein